VTKASKALAVALALAVTSEPVTANSDSARNRGLAWLVTTQKSDGSFSNARGLDVHSTGAAIEAMTIGGLARTPQFSRAIAWLANSNALSVDANAWKLTALVSAGRSASSVGEILRSAKNSYAAADGQMATLDTALWGTYPGYAATIPDTAQGYGGLRQAGISYSNDKKQLTASVLCYLVPAQQTTAPWSGSWGFSIKTAGSISSSGTGSLLSTVITLFELKKQIVAGRLLTQTSCGRTSPGEIQTAIASARTWLLSQATSAGGFAERNAQTGQLDQPSELHTALAIRTLQLFAAEGDVAAASAISVAQDWLLTRQLPDGSWQGDPFVTGRVLTALPPAAGNALVDTDADGLTDGVETLAGRDPYSRDSNPDAGGGATPVDNYFVRSLRINAAVNQSISNTEGRIDRDGLYSGRFEMVASASIPGVGFDEMSGILLGVPFQAGQFDLEFTLENDHTKIWLVDLCISGPNSDIDNDGVQDLFEVQNGDDPCNGNDRPLFRYKFPLENIAIAPYPPIFLDGAQSVWVDLDDDGDLDGVVYRRLQNAYTYPSEYNCQSNCEPPVGPVHEGWLSAYINNGDGYDRVDIAIGNFLYIYPWDSNAYLIGGEVSGGIFVIDYDKDGRRDVLMAMSGAARPLVLYRNISSGGSIAFADSTADAGLTGASWQDGRRLVVVDSNSDGYPDLVTPTKFYRFDPVSMQYSEMRVAAGLPLFSYDAAMQAVDIDGDQKIDFLGIKKMENFLNSIFKNNGDGTFTELQHWWNYAPWDPQNSIAVTDLDGDGKDDLVTLSTNLGRFGVYRNITDKNQNYPAGPSYGLDFREEVDLQSFYNYIVPPWTIGSPVISPVALAAGDIDSDGWNDILLTTNLGSVLLLGGSDLSLTPQADVGRLSQTTSPWLNIVDTNQNGAVDIDVGMIFHENVGYKWGNKLVVKLNPTRPSSGTDAIGASVRIRTPDNKTQSRVVYATGIGSPGVIEFGIGSASGAAVDVLWPSGEETTAVPCEIEIGATTICAITEP
jgi:hypothetical protein